MVDIAAKQAACKSCLDPSSTWMTHFHPAFYFLNLLAYGVLFLHHNIFMDS